MDNRIVYPKPMQPIQPHQAKHRHKGSGTDSRTLPAGSFQNILSEQLRPSLKFSNHAQQRLASRNINLSGEDLKRLEKGIEKVAEKGARDSLVLLDQLALVVSVRNRTVITAVDESSLKENVFTNIDSAVIV